MPHFYKLETALKVCQKSGVIIYFKLNGAFTLSKGMHSHSPVLDLSFSFFSRLSVPYGTSQSVAGCPSARTGLCWSPFSVFWGGLFLLCVSFIIIL